MERLLQAAAATATATAWLSHGRRRLYRECMRRDPHHHRRRGQYAKAQRRLCRRCLCNQAERDVPHRKLGQQNGNLPPRRSELHRQADRAGRQYAYQAAAGQTLTDGLNKHQHETRPQACAHKRAVGGVMWDINRTPQRETSISSAISIFFACLFKFLKTNS